MLGFRGCRLGIVYPEITEMQARAIFEAACDVQKEGIKVEPGDHDPARRLPDGARAAGRRSSTRRPSEVFAEKKVEGRLPRRHDDRAAAGALAADQIAKEAEFFSFGTNDLTQTPSA